jgi:hypothetical protein
MSPVRTSLNFRTTYGVLNRLHALSYQPTMKVFEV